MIVSEHGGCGRCFLGGPPNLTGAGTPPRVASSGARLLVETLAVEEWGDWHGARQITGGSAMVSQPTDLINVAQWSAAHRAGIWRCLFVFKIARPHGEPVAKLAGCR
jgi:hypothetical protein